MRATAALPTVLLAFWATPAPAAVTTAISPSSCQIEMAGQVIPCRNAAMTMLDSGDVVVGVGSGSTILMFIGGKPTGTSPDQFSVPLRRVRLPSGDRLNSGGVCALKMVGDAVSIACDASAEGGLIKLRLVGEGL